MHGGEWERVRVLLASREAFAALDPATLNDEQRSTLSKALRSRARFTDANFVAHSSRVVQPKT